MANVLCVLYDDPVDGYPPAYARNAVPKIKRYHDGQTAPSPEGIGFTPGELLGSVSGELGLREFLEQAGHRLIVTSDKDGPDSVFERELPEAEVVISQLKRGLGLRACGAPDMPLRPVGAAKRAFRKHGEALERIAITFTPAGGTPYICSFRELRRAAGSQSSL
jgi:hypothetical protein